MANRVDIRLSAETKSSRARYNTLIGFKDKYFIAAIGFAAMSLFTLCSCAHNFSHDGRARQYILYQPSFKTEHSGARPLLLVLHGGGGKNRGMLRLTNRRFNELADRDGFFVVYPQGIDKSWNEGRPDKISGAHRKGIDDVGFLRALIEDLIAGHSAPKQLVVVSSDRRLHRAARLPLARQPFPDPLTWSHGNIYRVYAHQADAS